MSISQRQPANHSQTYFTALKPLIHRWFIMLVLGVVTSAGAAGNGLVPADALVLDVYRTDKTNKVPEAHKGQVITVVVTNLEVFFGCPVVSNYLAAKQLAPTSDNLVPVINNIPLVGCKLMYDTPMGDNTHRLAFRLNRNNTDPVSKDHWLQLFNSIQLIGEHPVRVSVGFADGSVMGTDVHQGNGSGHQFSFTALPLGWCSGLGFALILAALGLFLYLAARTNIIRDPSAQFRPDGAATFSLARTQMAFWSFLVLASYFLLWLLTDDMDTIPGSVLALMGISAGTALGAALVDAGKTSGDSRSDFFMVPKPGQSEAQLVQDLVALKQALQTRLAQTLKALQDLPGNALVDRDNAVREQEAIEESMRRTDVQIQFYRSGRWKRFLYDILGDDGSVSFHRFQIAAWTLLLGGIFVFDVATQIAMPDFSPTVLGLMGLSGGTYVGFKIPGGGK